MVITFSKQEHHSRLLWCVASWGGTYIVQLVSVCFCGSLWESRTLHSANALLLHRAKILEIDCNSMISSVWSEETTTLAHCFNHINIMKCYVMCAACSTKGHWPRFVSLSKLSIVSIGNFIKYLRKRMIVYCLWRRICTVASTKYTTCAHWV